MDRQKVILISNSVIHETPDTIELHLYELHHQDDLPDLTCLALLTVQLFFVLCGSCINSDYVLDIGYNSGSVHFKQLGL